MKYQASERLRIAWHWLPLEVLVVVACVVLGWGLATIMSKTVYQARVDVKIQRQLSRHANNNQRQEQREKDIANVGQFSVMPHQSAVLYHASEYAYTHFGIWQPVQDLSESVTAEPIKGAPVLRVTVASSSRLIAEENSRAFRDAVTQPLKSLAHYKVTVTHQPAIRITNTMLKPMLKFMAVVGIGLATVLPYSVDYVRGRRWGKDV